METSDLPKTEEEWKGRLTTEQFQVCRLKGTDAPFSGELTDKMDHGTYICVACDQPLFSSKEKYHSGSGWPSFWDAIKKENVKFEEDHSLGFLRSEVQCSKCGSHLGHIFGDGPQPTGQRYCINSTALKFIPAEQ